MGSLLPTSKLDLALKTLRDELVISKLIGLKFDIVGGSYQPANNIKCFEKLGSGATLYVVRESSNRNDSNAFAVCLTGVITSIVGFMPRTIAKNVASGYDAAVKRAKASLKDTKYSNYQVVVKATLDRGTHGFYNTITIVDVGLVQG